MGIHDIFTQISVNRCYCHVLEQTKWLQLSWPFSKKAHAFAKIWTQDLDQDPEYTYALDRSAMAPMIGTSLQPTQFLKLRTAL